MHGSIRTVDLAPNHFGKFDDGRLLGSGEIEILIGGNWVIQCEDNSLGKIRTVGVVPRLGPVSLDVQSILSFQNLLH